MQTMTKTTEVTRTSNTSLSAGERDMVERFSAASGIRGNIIADFDKQRSSGTYVFKRFGRTYESLKSYGKVLRDRFAHAYPSPRNLSDEQLRDLITGTLRQVGKIGTAASQVKVTKTKTADGVTKTEVQTTSKSAVQVATALSKLTTAQRAKVVPQIMGIIRKAASI